MKQIALLLFILFSTLSYSQMGDYKPMTLLEAFNQEPAENRKDYCTTESIKGAIVFSSNIQRVVPDRATKLNELISNCGFTKTQDWTGATTEISVLEGGSEFWLQLDSSLDYSILNKISKYAKFTLYGQLLCEHFFDSTIAFFIVTRIEE